MIEMNIAAQLGWLPWAMLTALAVSGFGILMSRDAGDQSTHPAWQSFARRFTFGTTHRLDTLEAR